MHRLSVAGWPSEAALVRAVGNVLTARIEPSIDPSNTDHVWLTIDAGLSVPIEISINTFSRRNRDAGFDPRVRLGQFPETWLELPAIGVAVMPSFAYANLEAGHHVAYEVRERADLEHLLLGAARACARIEVIGKPYHRRPMVGIHQIHSRRASCAVPEEYIGHDGALRFYFPDHEARWMFFKFCGQP